LFEFGDVLGRAAEFNLVNLDIPIERGGRFAFAAPGRHTAR